MRRDSLVVLLRPRGAAYRTAARSTGLFPPSKGYGRLALAMGLAVALSACGTARLRGDTTELPASLHLTSHLLPGGLHLEGSARGPLPGLGPELQMEAWFRADGWLRADLRYERPDGAPQHDVILWTPDAALLVDKTRGGVEPLGEEVGVLDAEGAGFRLEHLVWLSFGRLLATDAPSRWVWHDDEWRGRLGGLGLRGRPGGPDETLAWTELVWRTDEGQVQVMTATVEDYTGTAWGPIPRRLALEGDTLQGRAVVDWSVQPVAAMKDSVFDPLSDP